MGPKGCEGSDPHIPPLGYAPGAVTWHWKNTTSAPWVNPGFDKIYHFWLYHEKAPASQQTPDVRKTFFER